MDAEYRLLITVACTFFIPMPTTMQVDLLLSFGFVIPGKFVSSNLKFTGTRATVLNSNVNSLYALCLTIVNVIFY